MSSGVAPHACFPPQHDSRSLIAVEGADQPHQRFVFPVRERDVGAGGLLAKFQRKRRCELRTLTSPGKFRLGIFSAAALQLQTIAQREPPLPQRVVGVGSDGLVRFQPRWQVHAVS